MRFYHRAIQVLTLTFAFLLSSSVLAELVINEGYVRKPIPGRSMSAAFMSISNTGQNDIVLKTAAIEGSKSVEMHAHTHDDGVMRMRQLHALTIKAGEVVVLEPGGLHLMLFGIKVLPEKPKLTLCDELKQCTEFSLSVRQLVQ